MMGRVRVCIIGGGRVGAIHLKALLDPTNNFTVTSIVDDSPSPAVIEIVSRYPDVSIKGQTFMDDVILGSDVVLIATPTFLHAEQIIRALGHGKHVLCEKPLVMNLDDVNRVYGLAREKGRKLLCGLSRRFDGASLKIKAQIDAGNLGRIMKVCIVNRDHPYPNLMFLKNSPILYYDNGTHDVDMMVWLTGEKPTEVYCAGACFDPQIAALGDDDNGAVILKFPSGLVGILDLQRVNHYGFDIQINVHGEKKSVYSKSLPEDGYVEGTSDGFYSSKTNFAFDSRFEKSFGAMWRHFYEAIIEDKDVLVTEDQVAAVILTMDAIAMSRKIGLPVVVDHEKRSLSPKSA